MTYDFHGAWEPNGTYESSRELRPQPLSSSTQLSVKGVVDEYLGKEVARGKLTVGLPFYGHGWARVPDNGSHGLYQSAGSLPRGTWEKGIDGYKVLMTKGYPEFWDDIAKASWC